MKVVIATVVGLVAIALLAGLFILTYTPEPAMWHDCYISASPDGNHVTVVMKSKSCAENIYRWSRKSLKAPPEFAAQVEAEIKAEKESQ